MLNKGELKKSALKSCEYRQHRMIEWWDTSEQHAESVCQDCGMGVFVDTHPPPNGIDISGQAVALNCLYAGMRTGVQILNADEREQKLKASLFVQKWMDKKVGK